MCKSRKLKIITKTTRFFYDSPGFSLIHLTIFKYSPRNFFHHLFFHRPTFQNRPHKNKRTAVWKKIRRVNFTKALKNTQTMCDRQI